MGSTNYQYANEIHFRFEKLDIANYVKIENFDCGNESINDFIKDKNRCLDRTLGVTYVFIDERDNRAIAFATIACSGITHSYQGNRFTIPAIEIKYFAIVQRLHRLLYDNDDEHYYLSDHFLCYLMNRCMDISEDIAAKYIILYSVERAKKLYSRVGFADFSEFMEPDSYRYINGCAPMFIEMN